MPRGVTRAAVSTSEDKHALHHSTKLVTYYCLCGEFILVIDKPLRLLARRQSDASYILRNLPPPSSSSSTTKRSYKLNSRPEKGAILIRRKDGYEKRIRQRCPRCELQIGYEAGVGGGTNGPCTYILHGALSEKQATAPQGALDEDPVASVKAAAAAASTAPVAMVTS